MRILEQSLTVIVESYEGKKIMKRVIALMLLAFMLMPKIEVSAAPSRPTGVPKSATKATVIQVKDGDKIDVLSSADDVVTVLLAGIDAPEKGECYYGESKRQLKRLLPAKTEIYLERSGRVDKDGNLTIRYVWLPGKGAKKASLVNTKLVRDGNAGFDDSRNTPKYFKRLENAQNDAKSKNIGLWKSCGELHIDADLVEGKTAAKAPTQEPTQAPVATGWTIEEQAYIDWIAIQTVTLQNSMDTVTSLTANFQVSDLFDQNWIIKMAVIAATWQTSYDSAVAYTPPATFAEVHGYWVEATGHLANAADYLTYGIDNLDAASIELAAQEINTGTAAVQQAADALNRLKQARGL